MRLRTKEDLVTKTYTAEFWNATSPGSYSITNQDYVVGQTNSTSDVLTPNFHKRVKAGEIIINPYKNVKTTVFEATEGFRWKSLISWTQNEPFIYSEQDHRGPQLTFVLDSQLKFLKPKKVISEEVVQQALGLAATKSRAEVKQGEAELLVFLAELHKTIRMLANPLQNMQKFLDKVRLDKLRHRDPSKRVLTLGQYISSEWLTYRYGVMPLLFDIDSIAKAIGKDRNGKRHSARAVERRQGELAIPNLLMETGSTSTVYNEVYTDLIEIKCGFVYAAEMTLTDHLGLNLRSVPSAVWELIPFSFVADWFLNIQHFVGAISPSARVDENGGYTVVTRTLTAVRSIVSSTIKPSHVTQATLLRPMSGSRTVIERTKVRDLGVPAARLVSKIDLSRLNFKDKRILDSFSLMFQKLAHR